MMKLLVILFALLREVKSVTITIRKKSPPCCNQSGFSFWKTNTVMRLTV